MKDTDVSVYNLVVSLVQKKSFTIKTDKHFAH